MQAASRRCRPRRAEGEVAERADGGERVAVAGVGPAAPVADRAHLGDAAADVGERDAAGQRARPRAEDEERIGGAGVAVAGIGGEAAAVGRAAQVVGRPGRLPGLQEGAADGAQFAPLRIVRRPAAGAG